MDSDDQRTALQAVLPYLGRIQDKLRDGHPLHRGDAERLKRIVTMGHELQDLTAKTVNQDGENGQDAELLRWVAYLQVIPEIITQAGMQVDVDLSPMLRAFDAWRNDAEIDQTQADAMMRDARVAWTRFEALLPEDPDTRHLSQQEAIEAARAVFHEPVTKAAPSPPAAERTPGTEATPSPPDDERYQRRRDPIASLLDDIAIEVLRIAGDGRGAEDRLQDISKLDTRFWGKDSPELAELLRVSEGRIRQTKWWKEDRPKRLAPDDEPATIDDI